MRRRWRGASIALVAVVALGAGCSSTPTTEAGGESSTTAAPSGTSAPESTTTTKGSPGTTESTGSTGSESLEAALIEASDLGSSWSRDVSKTAPSESVNQSFLDVPACAALAPSGSSAASAESANAEYDTSDGGTNPDVQIAVQYQVDLYPDEDDAAAVLAVVESPEFGSCFEALLGATGPEGGTVTNIAVTPLDLPSASSLGIDAAVGVEVTSTLTSSKGTADTVIHLVGLQHGSALGMFTVTVAAVNGATAPPLEVSQSAVEAAAKNLSTLGS